MTCQRIVIVGMPGAGKSTLCARLGKRFNIPYYHLDYYAWEGGVLVDAPILEHHVDTIVETPSWVVDGTYTKTLDQRLARADVLIVLTDARWRCILRVMRRYLKGRHHPQIGDNPHIISFEFIRYIWNYERDVKPKIDQIYQRHAHTCRLCQW
ncbi:DNA topology modulation protein FlaR [Staphylococcus lutrae]|uniref:DNA topology modulation protein FlaR n=1 Tax=Staphylococcus lutrae TaxID=155085 RepID=A0AAC9RS79_9STAP|nr:DNA topology modulation protein FlaR [Staphylococcus lutrae]ARJ50741.1 DNA topology modulation protein FlaR [Staphylococcus lutrae]PNZ37868.1 DNA topology modulation protein FlaR [Staphylococcus lutrae]